MCTVVSAIPVGGTIGSLPGKATKLESHFELVLDLFSARGEEFYVPTNPHTVKILAAIAGILRAIYDILHLFVK